MAHFDIDKHPPRSQTHTPEITPQRTIQVRFSSFGGEMDVACNGAGPSYYQTCCRESVRQQSLGVERRKNAVGNFCLQLEKMRAVSLWIVQVYVS